MSRRGTGVSLLNRVTSKPEVHHRAPDDSFLLSDPVDLRKFSNLDDIPDETLLDDESQLSNSLMPLIGIRIQTAHTPTSEERRDIDLVKEVAARLTTTRSTASEFHLSEHLMPPRTRKFGPEQAYSAARLVEASKDREMPRPTYYQKSRQFPYDMFKMALGRPSYRKSAAKTFG
jgi:hypothetical protein